MIIKVIATVANMSRSRRFDLRRAQTAQF